VQVVLESILLRREKNMRDSDGKRILELPPKEVTIETLHFSTAEQKIYDSIYDTAKRSFDQLNAKGLVGKNYTHILAMLMRSVLDKGCTFLWLTNNFAACDVLCCTRILS
jgi:DNA repair protein RAD5